jgi:hypothetical protein
MSRLRRIAERDRIFFITTNLLKDCSPLAELTARSGNLATRFHLPPCARRFQQAGLAGFVRQPDEWPWSSAVFYSKTPSPSLIPDQMDFSGDPDELLRPAPSNGRSSGNKPALPRARAEWNPPAFALGVTF